MQAKSPVKMILVTGLALFAMFFGAGNLIFPVMIGVQAGTNQVSATLGFLATGVLLPVLGMVAAATSGSGILGISERISHYPGLVYCWMIFLSTGVLYALPRTATASYEMSFTAVPEQYKTIGLWIYILVFFVIAGLATLNPGKLLEKIGGWLTPILLILLLILIVASLTVSSTAGTPAKEYAATPFITGLLNGYNTMDALASFAFGVVIISSLKNWGVVKRTALFQHTALAGIVAGVCLGIIYFGLSMVGLRVAHLSGAEKIENGGQALAYMNHYLFGATGAIIFGLIAILACLTTAMGLIGASTQFFMGLFPQINRRNWVIIHVVISLLVASMGLNFLLKLVVPMMYVCYPVTIALVLTCLVDIFVPGHLYWSYRLSVWISPIFGLISALRAMEVGLPDWLEMIPLYNLDLAWVVPVLTCFVIGFAIDISQGRMKRELDYDQIALERNQGLVAAGLAGNQAVN